MSKFKQGDRVVVDSLWYSGKATVVRQETGAFDSIQGYLVDTDRSNTARRSDGYVWVTDGGLERISTKEPKPGDRVYVHSGIAAGEKGVVNAVRPAGYAQAERGLTFTSDKGADYWVIIENCRVIERANEPEPEPQFKFSVGDRVYTPCGGGYTLDESERHGEVTDVRESGIYPGTGFYHVDLDGYGELSFTEDEIVEEKLGGEESMTKFNVGDRVKTTDPCGGYSQNVRGKYGTISSVGNGFCRVVIDDYMGLNIETEHLIPVAGEFKPGDKVRMISDSPRHGFGGVETGDIGTVIGKRKSFSYGGEVYDVDFPNQSNWTGKHDEFELADETEPQPKRYIKMLEHHDIGYRYGDVLEVTSDGTHFIDNDGDYRPLSVHRYVEATEAEPETHEITRKDVVDYLCSEDDGELLDIIEEAREGRF